MTAHVENYWKAAPSDSLNAMLGIAPIHMQFIDQNGTIVKVSDHWATLMGYKPEEMEGHNYQDYMTEESRVEVAGKVVRHLEKEGVISDTEFDFVGKDGKIIPMLFSAVMQFDKTGKFLQTVILMSDNRPAKRALLLAQEKAAEAQEASKAKSRFLAAMSHEIRTPMNAIMGFAQLLKLSNLDEKRKSHLNAIISAGGSLMNLLTDLLDLSQVEEGKMRIEPRDFELFDQLDQISDWWHSSAKQKGLRMNVELDKALPRLVRSDPVRLQQVLNNFLGNAVKFTERGSVVLRVLQVSRKGDVARIRFEVEDTGPGMDTSQIKHLFKPFVQIETDFGKERGGWGLGLSICSNIATRLGAKIDVESTPGEGSIFSFELDVTVLEAADIPPPQNRYEPVPVENGESLRVLLAEDNALNQDMMRTILANMGHEVETVANGFEAVEATIRHDFDLILMDIMMPGLDGIGATEQIRSPDNPMNSIPIVACSAHVAEEARERYLRMGMDAFVPKPIDQVELKTVIDEVMKGRSAGEPVVAE
jgi:PAS domain S-box-containing protein